MTNDEILEKEKEKDKTQKSLSLQLDRHLSCISGWSLLCVEHTLYH